VDYVKLLIRKLVTRDSGLAGLMLWIPMALGRKELDTIACAYTDGKTIFFCDPFFIHPQAQQIATIIHETLHVVLQHPRRFQQIRMSRGEKFNMEIANICADAIVIRAIKACPKIGPLEVTPNYVITAEDIVSPEDLKKIPGQLWTFEMLYAYLEKKVESAIEKFLAKHGKGCENDLQGGFQYNVHDDEVEGRVWNERFIRAQAGSQPGGILRSVPKDLPESKVPWQSHFKEFMIAHVMPTTTLDWGRPSRRLLASKGRLGYYEPGIQRDLGVRKAGIVIDSSGSIDESMLNTFISEANAIMEQTGCQIVLIVADAAVQSIEHFMEPIHRKFECKGGGGTDFRPALAELEKQEVDCCVYLTDMCGSFPDKAPSYPVMWAIIGSFDSNPPFGRKVEIAHHV
jgi:predicted metal-dependent peptidase